MVHHEYHVHLIIGTTGAKLEGILRDLKRHTSRTLLKAINENMQESRREWMLWMFAMAGKRNPNNKIYQFWQQHNHPIELWNNEIMDQKLEYKHGKRWKATCQVTFTSFGTACFRAVTFRCLSNKLRSIKIWWSVCGLWTNWKTRGKIHLQHH